MGVAPNDVECMISYRSSMHDTIVFASEKDLIQKNAVFALEAGQQYHIIQLILHYARNQDILATNTNNPSYSINTRSRTLRNLHVYLGVCVVREGVDAVFFGSNFSCTDDLLIRITFYAKIPKRKNTANITQLQDEKRSPKHIYIV